MLARPGARERTLLQMRRPLLSWVAVADDLDSAWRQLRFAGGNQRMSLFERKTRVEIFGVESGLRCEHRLAEATMKLRQGYFDLHRPGHVAANECGKNSNCRIDGRNYCGTHAGIVAIKILRDGAWRKGR